MDELAQPHYRALYDGGLAVYTFPDGDLISPPSDVAEVMNNRPDLQGYRPLGIIQYACLHNNVRASLYNDDGLYVGIVLANGRVRWHEKPRQ